VCQKAQKALEAVGKDVQFRDVRADPLSEAELAELIVEFGDRLVDQKSNDYRGLNDWLKNSEAEAQIAAKPKVMARPVIRDEENFYLGWDEDVQKTLLEG
jgi:arsenate reductase-like glutaredoxin family protein